MLYSNATLKAVSKEMKFGTVTGVAIGEYGRGRREVFLPTPKSVQADDVIKELRSDLTIGTSKSGRPVATSPSFWLETNPCNLVVTPPFKTLAVHFPLEESFN